MNKGKKEMETNCKGILDQARLRPDRVDVTPVLEETSQID